MFFRVHHERYRGEKIPRKLYGRVGYVSESPTNAVLWRTSGLGSPRKERLKLTVKL
jgi:hypothetical protein